MANIYCEMRVSKNKDDNSLTIIIPKSLNDENLSGIILKIKDKQAQSLFYFKNSENIDETWLSLIRESFFNNVFKWIIKYSTQT